ncbi:hypothetical protein BJ138DRAFT_1100596 [Hygrophoropsis aurantiaca]|uniref:Uncharacterized protein n=1 Tax=Hygrophoropsis aurantiaca TaxID=72124 RepID=A0ACB8AFD8_9AGAM|nr:hypothetical protein BJ138DRAFT_1100596 [Hygrophoropsis aurantiaca]
MIAMHIKLSSIFAFLLAATFVTACCEDPAEAKKKLPAWPLYRLVAWPEPNCEGTPQFLIHKWDVGGFKCIPMPPELHNMGSFDFRTSQERSWKDGFRITRLEFALHGSSDCLSNGKYGKTDSNVWIEPEFKFKQKNVSYYSVKNVWHWW